MKKYLKKIKNLIFILSLLLTFFYLNAQDKTADAKLLIDENIKLKKAFRLLQKAELENSRILCGNEGEPILWRIKYQKARLYYLQKEFQKGLKELDEISDITCRFAPCEISDSLKVQLLISLYGKSEVRKLVFSKSENLIKNDSDFHLNGKLIPLKSNAIDYQFNLFLGNICDALADADIWRFYLKEVLPYLNFYDLIKE